MTSPFIEPGEGVVYHRLVSVEEGYKLWAQNYDAQSNPLLSLEERTLRPLLKSIINKVVLDAGCGTGRWLERLLLSGARTGAGIDISGAMLEIARAKPLLRGQLVQGNCLALPFRPKAADLIICSLALAHIQDLESFAQELARVAKRDADVWVSEMHPEARAKGWTTGFRHDRGSAVIATFSHSFDDVHKAFQGHGFELSECLEPHLGELEKPIFAETGKLHLFPGACESPALLICHFRLAQYKKTAYPGFPE